MKQDNKTAAIYLRVSALDSRDVEGEDNRSHASTERDCLKRAEREGLTVTHVFREKVGTSASHLKPNSKRPQLAKALEGLGQEYSTIIFWALDRSTRWGMAECGEILARVEETNKKLVGSPFKKSTYSYRSQSY